MSTSPQGSNPPSSRTPDDALPPVSPPSTTFLLQLFFIPLLIVGIIVCVWLTFSWLAHAGNDPKDLVRDIRRFNNASWQKAHTLADILRSRDKDHLKDDASLAAEIAKLLQEELETGRTDPERVRLREFLCMALGAFRVTDGLPVLVKAALQERSKEEISVRVAAVLSIAQLANNLGPEKIRENKETLDAVLDCSLARSDSPEDKASYDSLRSGAAFSLGVIGGDEALGRLTRLMDDANNAVRFNAATGLARHGDPRCKPLLLEMCDPNNAEVVKEEKDDAHRKVKRAEVQLAAIQAIAQFWRVGSEKDGDDLVPAVQRLAKEGAMTQVSTDAKEALELRALKK